MNSNFGQGDQAINFLEVCCTKVACRFGSPNYATWRNSDYVRLSSLIKKQTKVHISENTLKRIFGKLKTAGQYTPQKATRDALAIYAGYRDWEELILVAKEQIENSIPLIIPPRRVKDREENVKNTRPARFILAAALLALATLAIFIYRHVQHDVTVMGSLYCKNPVGSSPHSAFFLVRNTEGKSSDLKNYWVDFKSWKRSKTQLRDTQFTYYYELPGVYFPVLGYKGKALDTARVVLNSDGWEVTAELEHDSLRVYPVAVHAPSFSNPPTVSSSAVYHAGVDTLKTFFLNYAWVKETGIQADNMEFSVDLKTSPNRPGVRCSQVNLVLYGERDKHYITLIKPQCSSWAHYKFSELEKDGERDDLRAFGHDLTAGRNVRVRIKNQMVFIFLENKQIFTTRYERPIGRLLGINIMFSGIGKISSPTWVSL